MDTQDVLDRPARRRPPTVLLVEDEDDQRELVTVYLRRSGCEVISAPSAEAGLDLIEGVDLDLAVVDLRLPGMSGWTLSSALHERDPRCPIVVTSVLDLESYPPAHTALPKPFSIGQLRTALGRLLPHWSPT
ncbi:response regulator [Rhodococcus sp. X156]|uniref:response regulator n=1 Tax=Rhodococcus sp. X156 TaxID=2499145 RepID=UPI0019CFEF3D|nr:response regulator [Rhodococcus sp. X156]